METEKIRPYTARWRDAILSADGPPKPTTRLVLLAVAKYMSGDGGSCWPSVDTLAADTGTSRRSVCTHIALARSLGWLHVGARGGRGQSWRRHQYRPSFPDKGSEAFSQPLPKGGERDSQPSCEGGEPRASKVVKMVHEGGERISHEQDQEQDREQGRGAQRAQRPRKRAAQLPRSFAPDETATAKARELGVDIAAELEKFRNHAEAHGRAAKNWQAAFRNWLIKASEFGRGQPAAAGRPSQRKASPSDYEITRYD